MVLNAATERMLELGGLRCGMLFWEKRAMSAEMPAEDPSDARPVRRTFRPATGRRGGGRQARALAAPQAQ